MKVKVGIRTFVVECSYQLSVVVEFDFCVQKINVSVTKFCCELN